MTNQSNFYNNPAGRLLNIIEEGKRQPLDKAIYEIWSILLSVPPNNITLLLKRLAYVVSLIDEIEHRIKSVNDINHDIFLEWMHNARSAFKDLNLHRPWRFFIESFDEKVIYGLKICADILSRKKPERIVDENLLLDIMEEVDSLITQINDSNFDYNLKDFLLEKLLNIKYALEEYKIKGIKSLENIINSTIGSILIHRNCYEEIQKEDIGSKLWNIINRLVTITNLAQGLDQLFHQIIPMLPK